MRNRDEKLEKQLASRLQQAVKNGTTAQKALALGAAAQLYTATGDEAFKTFVVETLSGMTDSNGCVSGLDEGVLENLLLGNIFYFAYVKTGEAVYETAAKTLARQLDTQARGNSGVFLCADGQMRLSDAYCSQVFYMNYETKNGGKERYNDIIAQFNGIDEYLYQPVRGDLEQNPQNRTAAAYYLAALIDTMEVMEQPIYEIFRRLGELFKQVVTDLLSAGQTNTDGTVLSDGNLMLAYAVLKACRMKVLHTEKYEAKALAILDAAVSGLKTQTAADAPAVETAAALALAYAESLKNRAYQEYGRNRGGVLWS